MERPIPLVPRLGVAFAALLVAGTALLGAASAQAAHPVTWTPPIVAPMVLVEGHVFDHRTGQPMAHVEVAALPWSYLDLSVDPSLLVPGPTGPLWTTNAQPGSATSGTSPGLLVSGPTAISDESGFYSLLLDGSQFRALTATCYASKRADAVLRLSSQSLLPLYDLREVRRDFYIARPSGGRRLPKCQPMLQATTSSVNP